ncbi:Prolipoprotein diacylglyceryl transferase [Seinonella peptonophila]|uniref:Phosphatidylglycerol--prolipoprotein diacylglyceryl transferase n=1 Tax=Seinonella peptonophila TaxID=112248 RepID=A0A1M4XP21_9BACL|nr:prolipoprotein diacylglyceryl transferase [Seinonella peptonophila]SHE95180.1 Prolipoprotein diacylglyceryl transferase [Seinonella peptonophila]
MFATVINPVAISFGWVSIHWYGIIMGSAALIGLWLATWEAKRRGIDSEIVLDLMIWCIPAAIIGARLYYVIFQWDYYFAHPADIIAVWKGGLAIHGGLIGAFLVGYLFVRVKKIPFLILADLIAPSILLGQMIGRWGNFINQEAHGGPVSRSFLQHLHLPNWIIEQMNIQGTYFHPTFLYESIWSLVGVALLLLLRYWNPLRGEVFFAYLFWYSLGRFFIEGIRTDSLAFYGPSWLEHLLNFIWSPMRLLFQPGLLEGGNIRIAQLVSFCLILLAIVCVVWRRVKGVTEKYRDMDAMPRLTVPTNAQQVGEQ